MSKINEIERLLQPIIESENMELVDIIYAREAGNKVLKIFLDKEGGIQLKDCELMSEKIGSFIDQKNVLPGSYVLEVSSPGLDRVLKKEKDFLQFINHRARISIYKPIENQRNFLGKIIGFESGEVKLLDISGKTVSIALNNIARARLEPEL